MLFSTITFIFYFLPVVWFFYYVVFRKKRKMQNVLLTFSSLFFYAWGEPMFALVLLLSIFANYGFGLAVDKYRQSKNCKFFIAGSVVFNITILFIFKYLGFFLKSINSAFSLSLPVPQIALPLGISFFTFQAMSYVIDVYRENGAVQKNPMNVALYITFFPQLIAGPIVRYQTVAEQINNRKETVEKFSQGICRFVFGLAKKVLISNSLAVVADEAFAAETIGMSLSYAWLGVLAYTFQIFFDFSGYSDMAIGLGKMFGFEFLENFDYPYISKSITEFWRRWHISLGTWFRDYVYFPLGGSRVNSKFRLVFNLFVVWMLTGVWHGANWTFVLWGFMYFVLIAVEKLTGLPNKRKFSVIGHIYTLIFVMLGWVLFRADSLPQAWNYLKVMFGASGVLGDTAALFVFKENAVYFVAAILLSTPVFKWMYSKISDKNRIVPILAMIGLIVLFLLCLIYIVKGTYNPFIYFNF